MKNFLKGVNSLAEKKKSLNSKAKGNRGELELCKILDERFEGHSFKRVPASGAMFGGYNRKYASGIDEGITTALVGDIIVPPTFKFTIEHKSYQEISFWDLFNASSDLHSWMKQCEDDADFVNKKPMLIAKFNNRKRIVFVKDKIDGYVFEHQGWYCIWLEDFLTKQDDNYFFDGKE